MDASPCQKLHLKISVGHFSCASLEAFNSWGAKPRMDNGQPMEAAILKKKNSEPFVHSKTETAIVLRK
jgi:hypothetical protein